MYSTVYIVATNGCSERFVCVINVFFFLFEIITCQ